MTQLKNINDCVVATPMTTIGMGNPGIVDGDTISEPISGNCKDKYKKKSKKRKMKKLNEFISEGLFTKSPESIAKSLYNIYKKNPNEFSDEFSMMIGELNKLFEEDDLNGDEIITQAIWLCGRQHTLDKTYLKKLDQLS